MPQAPPLPQIDERRCTGCGWCVAACPPHVLSLQQQGWRKRAVLHDSAACTGCRLCERRCPLAVITMVQAAQGQARTGSPALS
ncbi:MAG: 4Fe-4S dicluster domain-containing protein [Betaproteobacteria bacterium]|nr:4Fe-4S dicluster domain-containing protein [Betaproteobacteria bacterium]